jgi:hypothetical protein
MEQTPPAQQRDAQPIPAAAAAAAIAAAFVAMLIWSWTTWPDPTVDYGTQLYLAWQIAAGEVLYRDLAHFKGPLSQYVNGALFRGFGAGLRTLSTFNMLLFAGVVALIYRLVREFSDRLSATAATVVAVCVFGFLRLMDFGNYNWISPYAHEYTHGVALSLAMIALLAAAVRAARPPVAALAGGLCGMTFLTTAEVFAAAAAAGGIGIVLVLRAAPRDSRMRLIIAFVGAVLLPPLAGFALLASAMPPSAALRGTLGSWPWVFNQEIGALGFYREVLGIHDIAWSIRRMLTILAGYAAILGPVVVVALVTRSASSRVRIGIALASSAAVTLILLIGLQWFPWYEIGRPLPLFAGAIVLVCLARLRRRGIGAAEGTRLMLAIFGLVLLAKMFLNAQLRHYGFVLALPATVLVVEALIGSLPRAISAAGGAGIILRWTALAACAAVTAAHLYGFHLHRRETTVTVAGGADAFLSDARGADVNRLLSAIDRHARPGDTLAVFPQGLMINYLSRRPHPNRYINFMPPEVISAGEPAIVAAHKRHPPDLVVLVEAVTTPDAFVLPEATYLYGRDMHAWVKEHYEVVEIVRDPERRAPGWMLLKRSGATTQAAAQTRGGPPLNGEGFATR